MNQPAIIAPRVSKMSLVECLVDSHVVSALDKILCVGDRGRFPGNDYELLSHAFTSREKIPSSVQSSTNTTILTMRRIAPNLVERI